MITKVKYVCRHNNSIVPQVYHKWCCDTLYGSPDEFKRKHREKLSKLLNKNNLSLDDFCLIVMWYKDNDYILKYGN